MTEKLLQFAWQFKLISNPLMINREEQIVIVDPGQLNSDAGPDFFNAKIKMGSTVWVGNVEIHLRSSQWNQHNHQQDKAYNNVILHVVLTNDAQVLNEAGMEVTTVEVNVPDYVRTNFDALQQERSWLKCSRYFSEIDPFYIIQYTEALAIERLENKTVLVQRVLENTQNNWEQTCYTLLSRSLGFNVNSEPFEMLSFKLTHAHLLHYTDDLTQMEALLLGTAGFLDELLNEDDYYQKLAQEYRHLQQKYKLQPMEKHLWKFAKTRPSNFPTIRIAQLANIYKHHPQLFAKILDAEDLENLIQLFTIGTSVYWDSHYRFNAPSALRKKKLGRSAALGIIINTVVPLLFSYGKHRGMSSYSDRALVFLDKIEPEKNSMIDAWAKVGVACRTAKETQALLHLRKKYCEVKKCLQCKIGMKVLTINP